MKYLSSDYAQPAWLRLFFTFFKYFIECVDTQKTLEWHFFWKGLVEAGFEPTTFLSSADHHDPITIFTSNYFFSLKALIVQTIRIKVSPVGLI